MLWKFAAATWKRRWNMARATAMPTASWNTRRELSVRPENRTVCIGEGAEKLVPEAFAGAAEAVAGGAGKKPVPYHGYFYRILKAQGPAAEGGAANYVVKGEMIGGFALVAYPSEYGVTGVETFIVNHRGIVYEKDLGPTTATQARAMTMFNPGPGWHPVDKE